MKNLFTIFIVACLFINCIYTQEADDHVLVLTNDNFDSELAKYDNLLIEFYAPWCGHCKELAPEYAKAASIIIKDNPPLFLAKVDGTANRELASRFKLDGYPTIKLYVKGNQDF